MMTAAKSSKGKKPKVRTTEYRKRLESALQRLLGTGWLEKEARALRKKVGLPEEGLDMPLEEILDEEGLERRLQQLKSFWSGAAVEAQQYSLRHPQEKSPLDIFSEGIDRIMEESHLEDRAGREFVAGYVVGYLKTIDDMPLPLPGEGYIWTRLAQHGEDARIYELVETRQDWYPFDVDETPGPVSPRAACRQIAIKRLREKYGPFGDDMAFSEEELDREFYDVRNAYDREKKWREAKGD